MTWDEKVVAVLREQLDDIKQAFECVDRLSLAELERLDNAIVVGEMTRVPVQITPERARRLLDCYRETVTVIDEVLKSRIQHEKQL